MDIGKKIILPFVFLGVRLREQTRKECGDTGGKRYWAHMREQ